MIAFAHTNRLRGTHGVFSMELGEDQNNSVSSLFETVLSETVRVAMPAEWCCEVLGEI